LDKVLQLWYVSLDDKKPVLVDKSEYGTLSDGSWSPDSLWITYSKPHRRGSSDVFLYSLGTKKITMVSSGFYSDNNLFSTATGSIFISFPRAILSQRRPA